MRTIKISTNNFEFFDKFSKLNLIDKIYFEDTPVNRKRLYSIFNNINKNGIFIEGVLENGIINVIKKKDLILNVYYKKK
jgi:hypothetical protein